MIGGWPGGALCYAMLVVTFSVMTVLAVGDYSSSFLTRHRWLVGRFNAEAYWHGLVIMRVAKAARSDCRLRLNATPE